MWENNTDTKQNNKAEIAATLAGNLLPCWNEYVSYDRHSYWGHLHNCIIKHLNSWSSVNIFIMLVLDLKKMKNCKQYAAFTAPVKILMPCGPAECLTTDKQLFIF